MGPGEYDVCTFFTPFGIENLLPYVPMNVVYKYLPGPGFFTILIIVLYCFGKLIIKRIRRKFFKNLGLVIIIILSRTRLILIFKKCRTLLFRKFYIKFNMIKSRFNIIFFWTWKLRFIKNLIIFKIIIKSEPSIYITNCSNYS